MRYIDKSENALKGNVVVNQLLEDCWNTKDGEYKFANYDDLCKQPHKRKIIALLLKEQSNNCCYCMCKILNDHTITLEHIIPQNIKIEDIYPYFECDVLLINVIHRHEFDLKTKVIPPAKYPHDIAYYNLIASCNSNSHCNQYRGEAKIHPFIYDPEIINKIQYDIAGNAFSDEYGDELETLGITTNYILILIRLIRFKLFQSYDTVSQLTEDIIDDTILDLIAAIEDPTLIESFTGEPSYKTEVIKYQWFFNYYKNN